MAGKPEQFKSKEAREQANRKAGALLERLVWEHAMLRTPDQEQSVVMMQMPRLYSWLVFYPTKREWEMYWIDWTGTMYKDFYNTKRGCKDREKI